MNSETAATTPADFFLWIGSALALYVSVFSFLSLLFQYIDFAFPDPLSSALVPYSGSMNFDLAALIVLFPVFFLLNHIVAAAARRDQAKRGLRVRRWVITITLFLAAAMLLIDLILLITDFLGGTATLPFLLKTLSVLLVAAAGSIHYGAYAGGYWDANPGKAVALGWAAGCAVACLILTALIIMGPPWLQPLYRLDESKVNDLAGIQADIVAYAQRTGRLPSSLSDISSLSGTTVPADPQSGQPYEYRSTGAHSFELCAVFNAATQPYSSEYSYSTGMYVGALLPPLPVQPGGPPGYVLSGAGNNDWWHAAGRTCFERTMRLQITTSAHP